jgi:hypothetical protein
MLINAFAVEKRDPPKPFKGIAECGPLPRVGLWFGPLLGPCDQLGIPGASCADVSQPKKYAAGVNPEREPNLPAS